MENKREPERTRSQVDLDDSAVRSLSEADRKMLGMDAWEPSLLRKLMAAQKRKQKRR